VDFDVVEVAVAVLVKVPQHYVEAPPLEPDADLRAEQPREFGSVELGAEKPAQVERARDFELFDVLADVVEADAEQLKVGQVVFVRRGGELGSLALGDSEVV
jgi:hypothetical protein